MLTSIKFSIAHRMHIKDRSYVFLLVVNLGIKILAIKLCFGLNHHTFSQIGCYFKGLAINFQDIGIMLPLTMLHYFYLTTHL